MPKEKFLTPLFAAYSAIVCLFFFCNIRPPFYHFAALVFPSASVQLI